MARSSFKVAAGCAVIVILGACVKGDGKPTDTSAAIPSPAATPNGSGQNTADPGSAPSAVPAPAPAPSSADPDSGQLKKEREAKAAAAAAAASSVIKSATNDSGQIPRQKIAPRRRR